VYILVIQNALYVSSMDYNLLPPFMLREAGVIVRDNPKILLDDLSDYDHALTFPETGFRIPLSLWRVFSEDACQHLTPYTETEIPKYPELSKNYGTNDRMLRCKRIKDNFYMDTFFAIKKGGKSSRRHTCCQLFVTDKGFVYVVPMKRKGETLLAMKQFAKDIGPPDAFVAANKCQRK
jgi:hypothetical protein